jgi:hypothetical protein
MKRANEERLLIKLLTLIGGYLDKSDGAENVKRANYGVEKYS